MDFNTETMKQIKALANDRAFQEACADMAKLLFNKYQALQMAGFTEDEALYIVTHQGLPYAPENGD